MSRNNGKSLIGKSGACASGCAGSCSASPVSAPVPAPEILPPVAAGDGPSVPSGRPLAVVALPWELLTVSAELAGTRVMATLAVGRAGLLVRSSLVRGEVVVESMAFVPGGRVIVAADGSRSIWAP